MLCACSGEQSRFEEERVPSPQESLATRDYSAAGRSSRSGGDFDSKIDDSQVDDVVESTLRETLSLNYEGLPASQEARALLGRLEYQRGNFDAALQVFQGIDVQGLRPKMVRAISERTRPRQVRRRGDCVMGNVMSMHSVSLLIEAMLLKSKSLEGLSRFKDAALDCKTILDIIESSWPHGIPVGIGDDSKLREMVYKALELFPKLWMQAGFLEEAIAAYRRVLMKPWNLEINRWASLQKDLAVALLYGGAEVSLPPQIQQMWGNNVPSSNIEEAILLLLILMRKVALQEISWDPEVMNHLMYGLSLTGQFELLSGYVEQILPGIYDRSERWYVLALCCHAAGLDDDALNLLRKALYHSERKQKPHIPSLILGAKLCSKHPLHAWEGANYAIKATEISQNQKHYLGIASHFLGICYGYCARISVSNSQRQQLQNESLKKLQHAVSVEKNDPEVIYSLAKESAMQCNLPVALENATKYLDMIAGCSGSGWKLLALIVSAEQNLKEAEAIVDLAIFESATMDQLEFLHLKALLQTAQRQPKNAIETYRNLLAIIEAKKNFQKWNLISEVKAVKDLEMEAWLGLSSVYTKLGSWNNSYVCLDKANSVVPLSPKCWHSKGKLLEAQSLEEEALIALLVSLSIEPDYVPSMVSIAAILRSRGDKSLAISRSLLMNALRLEPTNHEAWLHLGSISKVQGSLHQAADCFQAAYELSQSSPVQRIV
ncbi:hypothetical protein ZIOFF_010663 [Zingiber officinale]|uniref:Uncharacterized protein n=1 Tax=Zingiber officinale TaxID=94328 RepID=A0A8J5HPV8_ZINOF|nr:hypothetical protein ZIOFF_010663 [Zingiber officinale]